MRLILLAISLVLVGCSAARSSPATTARPVAATRTSAESSRAASPGSSASSGPAATADLALVASPDVQAYVAWVDRTVQSVEDATSDLIPLAFPASYDSVWRTKVTRDLAIWTRAEVEAREQHPPASLVPAHAALVRALDQFAEARTVIEGAAARGNDATFAAGLDQALAAGQALAAARDQVHATIAARAAGFRRAER